MADPNGQDRVCATATGSNVQSCVDVNGGQSTHTLTSDQRTTIAQSFRGFILAHNGADITSNGANVINGSQSDRNFVGAVSQFVGTAIRKATGGQGWNGIGINLLDTRGMEEMEGEWGHGGSDFGYANGNIIGGIAYREIDLNIEKRVTFQTAGSTARAIFHERLHWLWNKDHSTPAIPNETNGEHSALDDQARGLLKAFGLSGQGCPAMGAYPGCQ